MGVLPSGAPRPDHDRRGPRPREGSPDEAKLAYANVVAILAPVLVLAGGTAVAAQSLITAPSQLGGGVIANGTVRKGTLRASRPAASALARRQGQVGPQGEPGSRANGAGRVNRDRRAPRGQRARRARAARTGATDVVIREFNLQIPAGASATGRATCPGDGRATGGGIGLTNGLPGEFSVWSSRPVNAAGDSVAAASAAGPRFDPRRADP